MRPKLVGGAGHETRPKWQNCGLQSEQCRALIKGSLYSVDWTTGLDYWTGILDSPLTPKNSIQRASFSPI